MKRSGLEPMDLNAPRTCPYCGVRQCLPSVLNCGPCMQNIWKQHDATKVSVRLTPVQRPSLWSRIWNWFLG